MIRGRKGEATGRSLFCKRQRFLATGERISLALLITSARINEPKNQRTCRRVGQTSPACRRSTAVQCCCCDVTIVALATLPRGALRALRYRTPHKMWTIARVDPLTCNALKSKMQINHTTLPTQATRGSIFLFTSTQQHSRYGE